MMWKNILHPVCLLFVFTELSECKKKSKSVTTVLDAKWEQTPLVLEIAEYLAEESSEVFWQFVDGVAALDIHLIDLGTEKAVYERALAEASRLLSPAQLSLLKLSVSLHVYSPRVEMYHQMALERGVKCPAAVDVAGTVVCEPHKIEEAVKEALARPDLSRLETFRLDHHYPGSENKSLVAILYGEIGTPEFAQFHKRLRQLATLQPVDYVLRHFVKERPNKKLRLSGYGVELQLKSTEYKAQDDTKVKGTDGDDSQEEEEDVEIEGFVISKLKMMYPDKKEQLEKLAQELTETSDQLAPLKVWQFQELSLQAAQRILSAPREEALHTFTHIAQNFPMQAKSLVRTTVNADFKAEMVRNQERFAATLNLQPSDTALFLNGIFFDMDLTDTMAILDSLRQELRVLEGLHASGITDKSTLSSLLGLDLSSNGGQDFAIDIRDSAIQWVNDLEVDKQYRRWSSSLMDLLRPTFPGMVRHLRRNLYNLVIIGDPSKRPVWPLVKLVESFYVHTAPLRLGLVFAVNNTATGREDAGVALLNAYNYVAEVKNAYEGLSFITDVYASVKTEGERDVQVSDVIKLLKARYHSADIEEILGEDTDYDTGRKLAQDFVQRSGLRSLPQALINGIPLPEKTLNSDEFEGAVLTEIMTQTPAVQKAVYRGDLTDGMNVLDYLMDQPNVMPRLNERILQTEDSKYLDLVKSAAKLSESMVYINSKHAKDKVQPLTYWVVADLSRDADRELLLTALEQMKSSGRIRVGVVINAAADADQAVNKLVVAALMQDPTTATVSKILKDADAIALGDRHPSAYGLKDVDWDTVSAVLEQHREQAAWVLGFPVGARGLVCNGRVLGPLDLSEQFTSDDYSLLERFTMSTHVDKVYNMLTKKSDELDVTSDMVMRAVSLLAARPQTRSRFELPELGEEHSVIKMAARDPSAPALDIAVVVDPVSRGAQKVGPILSVLQQATNCHIRIFLNCVDKHSDMPLKSFYRYVLEPEVQFTADGHLASGPMARFSNMPPAPLLTQNMHVPDNWLVESVASPYDLDNIRLEEVESVVHSQFELEYLLLEGHCFEAGGNPPRGLQITLGTESEPVQVDTIVMANLGYFQLKANPGAWILRLRQGRSADIFDITSHEGSDTPENSTDIKALISSFRPHVLKLRVTKKPDKLNMDLLGEDDQPNSGLWNSITSTFSSKDEPADPADTTINIFSVASGHLYERFLRIMMLSVLKNTKSPVKFWFLKNYLSPTFKDFLPRMAKEYGFEYELVQYKWPRWLHQQTEKQRIIWGYKILFLDVLFPLHIKKIIFVDADQVVRADMKELVDLDLGGAPYGYTPFCDSRTEMDGFRFWKQGYWRNHLQGRRYHISALYVVDLKRFRKIAAGDRLRGQYQALSQDPNSLSNLDQDLPNNMIHQVAIKSLPQEWLWCETWCDDQSKQSAKTIDLCNNPLTKEAKLTAAMRIVEEWKDYDDEIKRLQLRLGATDEHEEETVTHQTPSHREHSEL
ncbi:UDP-glucose:glycoprotein glucosyltransferase-like isoform X1 [Macrosteles quadrilineatus]|uniref:UDP-glucose:glycoprotein glucosyltransferase-like isoform X1 n=1 Tax=Macrosteles quadrilineatus TaxID=74068 RepID=UPI0023E2C3D5|nr:UDP-glucose:glycoprotein glucosyltransferase-like isoform X1 [Macrosteles quadrilineatus]XP_054270384.1 UDP-glucose:glycoprotein glucosyltransferase-like isoform X1 [Macrosteles quadrilineatus]